jgi:hypothetical protein
VLGLSLKSFGVTPASWAPYSANAASLAVFLVGLNEDIKIFGPPRFGVKTYGMTADNEVFNSMCVELLDQLFVVLQHLALLPVRLG